MFKHFFKSKIHRVTFEIIKISKIDMAQHHHSLHYFFEDIFMINENGLYDELHALVDYIYAEDPREEKVTKSSYKGQLITVEYDARKVSVEEIQSALEGLGFRVVVCID